MECEIVQCMPLAGACSLHEVEWKYGEGLTPVGKNFTCTDDVDCFYLAVAAHFTLGKNVQKVDLLTFLADMCVKKVREGEAVRVEDVGKFEDLNPHLDLAINIVYQDQKGKIFPVRASRRLEAKNVIVLMLFYVAVDDAEGELDEVVVSHYALMREPEKLLAKRTVGKGGARRTSSVFICWNCFNSMKTRAAYEQHVRFCHQNACQIVSLPDEGETRSFEGDEEAAAKSFESAFMLFFDFEALQIPSDQICTCTNEQRELRARLDALSQEELHELRLEDEMLEGEAGMRYLGEIYTAEAEGRQPRMRGPPRVRKVDACPHKTQIVAEQPPFSYSLVLVDRDFVVREEKTYVGEDAARDFVETVLALAAEYLPSLTPGIEMRLTEEEEKEANNAKCCYLCGIEFDEMQNRVRDHDHLNGKFLGVAHNLCNLRRRERCTLTCFAHNFSGYDSHFLIRAFSDFPDVSINAIPLNTQKFKFLSVNRRIKFVDSFAFLSDSLAKLVTALQKGKSNFPVLRQLEPDDEKRSLLLRKGVFPYEFCTSIERLQKQKKLPAKREFANKLTGQSCSAEDYAHAQLVWKTFECENMLDYSSVYVKSDVYQLADVVLNFRKQVWQSFRLDLCQYMSLPHLGFDCMLKSTKVELELISDHEMVDLLKRNIRGGLSFVGRRHAESGEDSGDIVYIDANNLYGKAMTYPLPLRSFRWMQKYEIDNFDVMKDISEEEGPGYILEVDLDYPPDLHLRHNSFPLAPERITVGYDDLSDYSKVCLRAIYERTRHSSTKLAATFRPR